MANYRRMKLTRRLRQSPPWAHRLLKPALFVAGLRRTQELSLLEGAERSGFAVAAARRAWPGFAPARGDL